MSCRCYDSPVLRPAWKFQVIFSFLRENQSAVFVCEGCPLVERLSSKGAEYLRHAVFVGVHLAKTGLLTMQTKPGKDFWLYYSITPRPTSNNTIIIYYRSQGVKPETSISGRGTHVFDMSVNWPVLTDVMCLSTIGKL